MIGSSGLMWHRCAPPEGVAAVGCRGDYGDGGAVCKLGLLIRGQECSSELAGSGGGVGLGGGRGLGTASCTTVPRVQSGSERGRVACHVLAEWRWWLGVAASLLGLALHATALHLGSLTIVQPVAVTALFFAMVFRDLLDHRAPPRGTVVWGVITAVGSGCS